MNGILDHNVDFTGKETLPSNENRLQMNHS